MFGKCWSFLLAHIQAARREISRCPPGPFRPCPEIKEGHWPLGPIVQIVLHSFSTLKRRSLMTTIFQIPPSYFLRLRIFAPLCPGRKNHVKLGTCAIQRDPAGAERKQVSDALRVRTCVDVL